MSFKKRAGEMAIPVAFLPYKSGINLVAQLIIGRAFPEFQTKRRTFCSFPMLSDGQYINFKTILREWINLYYTGKFAV